MRSVSRLSSRPLKRLCKPAAILAAAVFACPSTSAADMYWDTTTTGLWSNTANWWTSSAGTTNPGAAPGSGDLVFFNGSGVNGPTVVQINANTATLGMTFTNTGTTLIDSSSTTSNTLTIGASGITINAGSGAMTLGNATNLMPIAIAGSQSWTNNSANPLTVVNGISNTLAGAQTLTVGGTGDSVFSGIVANGTGTLGLNKTGNGTLTLTGVNTYSGGTAVTSGTLQLGNGTINPTFVGSYSVSSGATLRVRYNASGVVSSPNFSTVTGAGTLALATGKSFDTSWAVPALTAGFTGTFQIEGGRIVPTAASNFGGATLINILNGGQLALYNFGNNTLPQNLQIAGTGYGEAGFESAIRMANAGQTTTLSGTVALSASATLAAGGTSTVTGVISGAAGSTLTFGTSSQNGTVILTNANTYSGGTTIAVGTLQLGNGGTTGTLSTSSTIVDNGTFAINRSNAVAQGVDFSGAPITGTGGFTQAGSGTTTLTAANTFSGATNVSAGSLNLSNALALQNSTLATGGTGIIFDASVGSHAFTVGGLAGSGNLALADNAGSPNAVAITVGSNNFSNAYSGALSGAGPVTKIGTGLQALSGANTYTGGTNINAGTLQFGKLTSTPATGGIAVNTGATLAINVGGSGEWTTGASGAGTIGGLLAGVGGQSGSAITYTGAVGLGFDTTNAPSTQTYSNAIANVGTSLGITKLGTGTFALTAANTYTGATTVNGGTLTVGGSGTLGSGSYAGNITIASGATFNYASSANQTLSGTHSGAGALTVNGTGTLTLSNAATTGFPSIAYTGGTTINSGKLKLDVTARSNDSGGFSLGVMNVAAGGTLELFTSKTVAFGTQDALVANGTVISGSGTINKTGSGVVDLWYSGSGTSPSIKNFTGQINIQAGILSNQTSGDWSTSAGLMSVDISSGASFDLRTSDAVINKLTGSGNVGASHTEAHTLTIGGGNGNAAFSGVITNGGIASGTGVISLTKIGTGTQTFNGTDSSTYTGTTNVKSGTLLLDFTNLPSATNLLSASTPLTLGGGTLSIVANPLGTTSQTVASLSLTAGTNSKIVVTPNGSDLVTLTIASNTVTTGTGATVNFDYSSGSTNGTSIADNIVAWNPTLTAGGIIGNGYTVTDAGGTGFATVLSGNVVRLTDSGSSGLPTTGGASTSNYFINQSYSTDTPSTPGSLVEALSGAVAANTVTVDTTGLASGAKLDLGGNKLTLSGMTFNGPNDYAITATSGGGLQGTSGGSVAFNNYSSGTVTISAPILANGTNAVTFAGTGTTVLTGANTYTGGTTIASGTLRVGDGGTTGNLGSGTVAIGLGANLTFNRSDAISVAGVISGGGSITQAGTGTVTLSGNNTFTGAVTVDAGTLELNGSTYTFSGSGITLNNGATLRIAGSRYDFNGKTFTFGPTGGNTISQSGSPNWVMTFAGTTGNTFLTTGGARNTISAAMNTNTIADVTFNVATGTDATTDLLVSGVISNGRGIIKTGDGRMALTAGNTYTGVTNVNAGTLTLGVGGALNSTSAITIASGATLNLSGGANNQLVGTSQTGALTINGALVATTNFAHTMYFSSFAMNDGTLSTSTTNSTAFGAFFFNGAKTITATGANTISGAGVIGISSGNVLTLSPTSAADSINVTGTIGIGTSGTAGGVTKAGAGTVTFGGVNIYTGPTNVTGGTLRLSNSLALQGSTLATGGTGIVFDSSVATHAFTFGGLAGSANLALADNAGSPNAVALTVGNNNATTTYTGVLSGAGGALTKIGTGTLTLSGANTYSGTTTVSAGTLQLNDANALPGGTGATGGSSALTLAGGVVGAGAGDFLRPLGTGASQVQWTGSGGFAAYTADRAVNLGGAGATVTWASGSFVPNGSSLILAAATADKTVDFQNPINLNNGVRTIQVDNGSAAVDAKLTGAITSTTPASGGLTKIGNGALTIGGTAANTYTGATTVDGTGILILDKPANVTAIGGDIAMVNTSAPTLYFTPGVNNQLSGTGILSFTGATGNSRFDLMGSTQSVSGVNSTVTGSVIQNSEAINGAPSSNTAGTLVLTGSGNYSFTGFMRNGSGSNFGTLALTMNGSGSQTLIGTNITYTGATTVNSGTLVLQGTTALPSAITVNSGGTLELNYATNTVDTWYTVAQPISGTGTVNKTGAGWIDVNSATWMTGFNGTLNIQQGTFGPGGATGRIGGDTSTMAVNVSSGALFDIRATTSAFVKIDKLTGTGIVGSTFNLAAGFTVGTGGGSSQFDGTIVGTGGQPTNNAANPNAAAVVLTKVGAGTFTVTGINTYAGGTTITGGTFLANTPATGTNSATGTGAVSVGVAGTLGGTGQVRPGGTAAISVSGALAPGASIGTLTIDSSGSTAASILTMAGGSSLKFELGAAGGSITSIGISDQVVIANSAVSDVTFNNNTVDFQGTGSNGFYKLFDTDLASAALATDSWNGLTYDTTTGVVSTGLTGTNLAGGATATFLVGTATNGGDLGDIYVSVVPEPSSGLLAAGTLGGLLTLRRRRRRL